MVARDAQRPRPSRGLEFSAYPSRLTAGRNLTALGVVVLLWVSAPAQAASLAQAKKHFRAAEALFARGEYAQAAALYEKAHAAKALPAFFINMGQCHRKLGDCSKAISYYQRYLVVEPTGAYRAKAEALIKACEEEVAANQLLEEQKRQADQQADRRAAAATSAAGPSSQPVAGGAPPGRKGLHPIYFWSSVGLGAAMLLTGTVTGGLALSKSSSYNDPATPAAELPRLKDAGGDLKVTATVTFTIGLAAAAGAAVLYFFTDFSGRERPASASGGIGVSAAPLQGGGLFAVGGSF